jgi:hypothetical protein
LRPYVGGNPGAIKDPYVREAIQSLHQYALQLNQVVGFKPTSTNTTTTVTNTIVQPGGVTAHSQLTGLLAPADDHKQYLLLSGRVGGQIAYGGLNTANVLVLRGNPVVAQPINAGLTLSNGYASSPIALISDEASYSSGGYTLLMLQFTSTNTSGAGGGAKLFSIRNTVGTDDIFSVTGYSTPTAVVRTGGLSLSGFGSGATLSTLLVSPTAASIGAAIVGASGQTADLLRVAAFSNLGTPYVKIAADGQSYFTSSTTVGTVNIGWGAGGSVLTLGTVGSSAVMKFLPNSTAMPITCDKPASLTLPGLTLLNNITSSLDTLVVKGYGSGTANYLSIFDNSSSTTAMFQFNRSGQMVCGDTTTTAYALLSPTKLEQALGSSTAAFLVSPQTYLKIVSTSIPNSQFFVGNGLSGPTTPITYGTYVRTALSGATQCSLLVSNTSTGTGPLQAWANPEATVVSSVTNEGYFSTKQLLLNGSSSGTLTIVPTAAPTSHTWTLPATQGAASTVLTNDGAGGLSWTARETGLFTLTSNDTCANTTSETDITNAGNLGSAAMGTRALGSTVRVMCGGILGNAGITETLTIRLKHATTVLCTTGAWGISSFIPSAWLATALLTWRSATTVIGSGLVTFSDNGTAYSMPWNTGATAITVGSTGSLSVTAQWSAASASNTITCLNCVFETVY